jgi:hypothetical protein
MERTASPDAACCSLVIDGFDEQLNKSIGDQKPAAWLQIVQQAGKINADNALTRWNITLNHPNLGTAGNADGVVGASRVN